MTLTHPCTRPPTHSQVEVLRQLDLAIAGRFGGSATSDLYHNVGGTLVTIGPRLGTFADGDAV